MHKSAFLCLLYLWPVLNFLMLTCSVSLEMQFVSGTLLMIALLTAAETLIQTALCSVPVISVGPAVSLVSLRRWYLKAFIWERPVLSVLSEFLYYATHK